MTEGAAWKRDPVSGGLVNTDVDGINRSRAAKAKRREREREIEELKRDVAEIKEVLKDLLKKKKKK